MAAALSSLNGKLLLGLLVTKAALLFGLLPFFLSIYPELYQANFFPDSYDLIAMNLIEGNGYRVYESTAETMIRLPGFVLVLAGVFSVFGKSILVVQGINLLCTVATCYLIQRVGERFLGLGRFSYLAAFFFAF